MREVKMQTPEWWLCDECEQNKLSSPSPKTIENKPKTQKLSVILQQTASVKESEPKSRSPSQLGFKEKWANKGKTQFISFNEAVKLSSGSVKPNPTRVFQLSTGLNEKTTPFGCEWSLFQSPQKERNVRLNLRQPVVQQSSSPKAVRSSMPSSCVEGTKPEREMKTSISELLHPKKAADISVLKEESHKLFKEHEKTGTASGTKIGSQTNADVEAAGKPNLTMLARAEQENIHDVPASDMHDPYIPSFNSYWKGCFNLPNGSQEFNETFTGHLPSKTHYKVYEATKKLPENISFELVSNCEIRTEIFPADTE
ncbi:uncharacterized protein LOC143554036 isoform X2 [Bidens hawaiensis]|uniref:uncharacterized protein LOC143554036 isoform X2 n=1 Tax=Bidens hawaiensis TaxID=980011 RepID=UPI004049DA89